MTLKLTFKTNYQANARKASEAAAKAVFQVLNARFQAALGTPAFTWDVSRLTPGVQTTRSNGQVVGSPRNIVDTGNLRQSNTGPQISGLRVRYQWTAPYAAAVHEGAVFRNGTTLPARPWTGAVLGTEPVSGIPVFDYRQAFKDTWLKKFSGGG